MGPLLTVATIVLVGWVTTWTAPITRQAGGRHSDVVEGGAA